MTSFGELTGDYVIDPGHTRIGFVARHTMATRVRGQFDAFEGSAHLDGDDPSKSSVQLTIRTGSIQTHDRRRDEHLRGKFLDSGGHPVIIFTSTRVERAGQAAFKVTGDLTIRGVTAPACVDFTLTGTEKDPSGEVRVGLAGSATIDRMHWGVNWNTATKVLVSQKVMLRLEVAAIRLA